MFGTIVPRVGTPEDIAGLVAYLVSKEADFVTGEWLEFVFLPDSWPLMPFNSFVGQSVSINGGGFYD